MMEKAPDAGPNEEQAKYWQSPAGQKWVDLQDSLDRLLGPVSSELFARAAPAAGEQVLDLGCGTGATTLALAQRVGGGGHVVGLDISPLLLAKARARTPPDLAKCVEFIEADAQAYDFGSRRFDLLTSRFGSMFFADPAAAFRNLRRGLRSGARIHLAAWGPMAANPWFAIPPQAAVARLGPPPPADPRAPGPLAFADQDYVLGILREAGFPDPSAETVPVQLEPPGSVAEVARLALSIGPAPRLIAHHQGGAADVEAIGRSIETAVAGFAADGRVRVPAQLNLFAAVAP
jgi:SAM-dependent methyltransferase